MLMQIGLIVPVMQERGLFFQEYCPCTGFQKQTGGKYASTDFALAERIEFVHNTHQH